MANAVITFKIMPESVDADLDAIEEAALKKIFAFTKNEEHKVEIEPVAFGLKAVNITFVMDENLGSPEDLEKEIAAFDNVMSCETTDVRRAIG